MDNRTRTLTAIHESAHAVVALELGVQLIRVNIQQRDGRYGCCDHARCDEGPHAVILAAGIVAEQLITGRLDIDHGRDDWKALHWAIRRERPEDAARERALQAARRIVRERWADVEMVAGALLRTTELTGIQVKILLRRQPR